MKLLLATGNQHKVQEMQHILKPLGNIEVVSARDFPEIPEPEETGQTFLENARLKALHYAKDTGLYTLADDSGLVVDALGGRPGVYSSRYGKSDADRIGRLLGELEGVEAEKRTARFQCAMVLARGNSEVAHTLGTLEGQIAFSPRGEHGFGYDPVFYVPQLECNLAEVEQEVKNQLSHRGRALKQMLPILQQHLGGAGNEGI